MSEPNANAPGGDPEPVDTGSSDPEPVGTGSGYGFILGVVFALVVIALLAYFLLLSPSSTVDTPNASGAGSSGADATMTLGPSAWHLLVRG
jgi:hypothetical protein